MNTIGIDGNEANIKNRVGVNVYAFNILWELYKLQDGRVDNRINYVIYLKNTPLPDLPKVKKWWKYQLLPERSFWVITRLMPHLLTNNDRLNVLFSPSHYTVPISRVPRVSSIMDLGYLESTEQFEKKVFWQLKYWSAITIYVSKYIIAISDTTKRDIVRHYPFATNKVRVTLLSYDKQRFHSDIPMDVVRRIKKKYTIVNDYMLYLGTLKPSKNVVGVVKGFLSYVKNNQRDSATSLVIAGKKGWMYQSIYELVKSEHIEDRVIFTDFIDETDKPVLMKGAKALLSPSYWEGFGIHVLESLACGTPVIISRAGSLPEVAGDAAIYCDPNDIGNISKSIERVIQMPKSEYNKLVELGIKQAEKFDWKITAKKTLDIILNAI